MVEISGQGLPTVWPSTLFSMKLVSNGLPYDVDVHSVNSGAITINLPEGTADQVYTLTFQDPN